MDDSKSAIDLRSAIIPSGWLYIIFIGKRYTGLEVFGDKIWIVLLIDTLFGLSAFLVYYWRQGNFKKLV